MPGTLYASPPLTQHPDSPLLNDSQGLRYLQEDIPHAGTVLGADGGLQEGSRSPQSQEDSSGPGSSESGPTWTRSACAFNQVTAWCVWRGVRVKQVISRRCQDSSPVHGMNLTSTTHGDGHGRHGGGDGPIRQWDQ